MRFHGTVGYGEDTQTSPGVWTEVITEIEYFGDVLRSARRLGSPYDSPQLNEGITLENSFSIVADAYAYENFAKMKYVSWNGSRWKITRVEDQRPRLILTAGGIWNGNTP